MDERTRQEILPYHFGISTDKPSTDYCIDVSQPVRGKLGLDSISTEDSEAQFNKDKGRFQTTCFFLTQTEETSIRSTQLENSELISSIIGENFIPNYIHQSQYTVGPLSLILPMNAEQSCSVFINERNKDLMVSVIHNPTLLIPARGADFPLKIIIVGEIYLLWDLSKSDEDMLVEVLCEPFLAKLIEQDDILTVCEYFNFILQPPKSENEIITITPDNVISYEKTFDAYLKNLEFIKQYSGERLTKSQSGPISSRIKKDRERKSRSSLTRSQSTPGDRNPTDKDKAASPQDPEKSSGEYRP